MSKELKTDIVLNLKGDLVRKAKAYSKEMATLGSRSKAAFSMVGTSAVAASRGIDTLGNRMMFVAGTSALVFERTFVKTAAEFERYQVMLDKLQGSSEGGAQAMSWIEQFTQDTPYAVNEVTQSFVKLKAFGLDPMDGTMQAIADQAAMMGGTAESVDGIATALGQAWTKGKLQGEEALQLLERGVPVWDYLNKASKELGHNNGLGYTTAQLQEMASQGKLTRKAIKDLIEQMGIASEGSAKKQMETWNGMISNIGDHWKIFRKDVMESGAFEELKKELSEFLSMLDEMKANGKYDEFVKTVGKDLVDGFRAAADAAREIKNVGQELVPIVKQVASVANSMVEVVGGYGNLAKILASVYAINKALSISAPILKGGAIAGGWIYDKARGNKKGHGVLASGLPNLTATPVFVVNWPGSGFGSPLLPDLTPDFEPKKNKPNRLSKAIDATGKAFAVGYLMEEIFGDTDFAQQMKKTTLADIFPSVFDSKPQGMETTSDRLNKLVKEQSLPAYLTGNYKSQDAQSNYPIGGDVRVKVDVSDNRVKTTVDSSSPSIKVDPDTGIN